VGDLRRQVVLLLGATYPCKTGKPKSDHSFRRSTIYLSWTVSSPYQ